MILGVRLRLRVPDDLLGIDGLAVDDCGDLAVGAARVKADAAALHMATDGDGGLVCLRQLLGRAVDDLERHFIDVLHELHVERALAREGIGALQTLRQRAVAADPDAEAADGPQQEFYIALDIAIIGLGHFRRAVDLRLTDGDLALIALERDGQGLFCAPGIGLEPHAEGDKVRIELRHMLDGIFNA